MYMFVLRWKIGITSITELLSALESSNCSSTCCSVGLAPAAHFRRWLILDTSWLCRSCTLTTAVSWPTKPCMFYNTKHINTYHTSWYWTPAGCAGPARWPQPSLDQPNPACSTTQNISTLIILADTGHQLVMPVLHADHSRLLTNQTLHVLQHKTYQHLSYWLILDTSWLCRSCTLTTAVSWPTKPCMFYNTKHINTYHTGWYWTPAGYAGPARWPLPSLDQPNPACSTTQNISTLIILADTGHQLVMPVLHADHCRLLTNQTLHVLQHKTYQHLSYWLILDTSWLCRSCTLTTAVSWPTKPCMFYNTKHINTYHTGWYWTPAGYAGPARWPQPSLDQPNPACSTTQNISTLIILADTGHQLVMPVLHADHCRLLTNQTLHVLQHKTYQHLSYWLILDTSWLCRSCTLTTAVSWPTKPCMFYNTKHINTYHTGWYWTPAGCAGPARWPLPSLDQPNPACSITQNISTLIILADTGHQLVVPVLHADHCRLLTNQTLHVLQHKTYQHLSYWLILDTSWLCRSCTLTTAVSWPTKPCMFYNTKHTNTYHTGWYWTPAGYAGPARWPLPSLDQPNPACSTTQNIPTLIILADTGHQLVMPVLHADHCRLLTNQTLHVLQHKTYQHLSYWLILDTSWLCRSCTLTTAVSWPTKPCMFYNRKYINTYYISIWRSYTGQRLACLTPRQTPHILQGSKCPNFFKWKTTSCLMSNQTLHISRVFTMQGFTLLMLRST